MERFTTATIVRVGAVVAIIVTLTASIGGWLALNVVQATLTIAPNVERAAVPTADLATAVDNTLTEVRAALETAGSITGQVAGSTGEAADVLDEVANLSTGQVADSLTALRDALPALIDTAGVIDDTMRTLSIFGVDYQPQVPLDEAFAEVEAQLEGLPETMRTQGERLGALVGEIRATGEDSARLAAQIDLIADDLADVQRTVTDYDQVLEQMSHVSEMGERISVFMPFARLALLILGLAGLVLGAFGWELGRRMAG